MPTPIDKAMQSRNLFFGFAGAVVLSSLWSIWGGDMFPPEKDPKGDPDKWSLEEMRRWLAAVGSRFLSVDSASLAAVLGILAAAGVIYLASRRRARG